MMRGKAFLIVGHRHCGKSSTLRTLTTNKLSVNIKGQKIPVRRMWNDDIEKDFPERFWAFVEKNRGSHMVIALCPNFDADAKAVTRKMDAPTILNELRKSHELLFWVIKHRQDQKREADEIKETEIERLRKYGSVELFTRRHASKVELSRALEGFLEKSLR